jgi:hypothetical protein
MQSLFNDVVDWPTIFARWLPEVEQVVDTLQRCPGCQAENCFELLSDWERSGTGLCRQCGFGEGLVWLKLAYKIHTDTAEQIVRGEISSAAELIPLRKPRQKPADNPFELIVEQSLKTAKSINLSEENDFTRYLKRLGISCTSALQDLYFDPDVKLHRDGKKPVKCSAILLVQRDKNNRRLGIERIFLTEDGDKIDVVQSPIKARAEKAMLGTAVRLSALRPKVLVAVSIESALVIKARFPDQAVVAALKAEWLKALQLPDFVCNVILVVKPHSADADAAIEVAQRLENKGCYVHITHDLKATERACYQASVAEVC